MNPEPPRAEALFLVAADIAIPQERSAFLDRECRADPALRARVEALLASHDEAGDFLQPIAPSPEVEAHFARLKPEEEGERIGHYKLLEQIGEGGFGVVWMAEQEHPVRRRVALKIIKLGMDTKEVIARFEQERQALAMMDHPNIAKVFDAGATPFGRPYFVMELVRGVKITEYCDAASLPPAERLQLFIAVCQAVQHAHQKGIIHRDLKPSNILVSLHDGVPVPKVIDFGVAKAIQSRLTERTLFTRVEQMIGTPLYMSPEQAELSGLDIDTRSDIYALGVLLYELLTGQTPLDAQTLAQASYDEIRRMIREEEPTKPSTVAAGKLVASAQPGGDKTAYTISNDLDWIVMKAIEKDRTRRYETASNLALDIQRYLEDEPISARPPSAGYLFRKFARRHKAAIRAAAALTTILLAGAIVSTWMAVRATRAEHRATDRAIAEEVARQEAEAITTYLLTIFRSADPARDGRTITVAETLDRAAQKIETDLAGHAERQARLREVLSLTFRALGLPREAIALQERALDGYVQSLGREHPRALDALHSLANCYYDSGRPDEALLMREQLVTLRLKVHGPAHPDALRAIYSLANSYGNAGRHEEAARMQEQVLRECQTELGLEHPDTLETLHNLAKSYDDAGRREEALQLREQVLGLRRKVIGREHPDTLRSMHNLAGSYHAAGRHGEAIEMQEELVQLREKVLGPEAPTTLSSLHDLATSYDNAGRREEALKLREKILELSRKVLGTEHPDTLKAMAELATSLHGAGRDGEAIPLRQEVLSLSRKVHGPEHLNVHKALKNLANAYDATGRGPEALPLWEEAFALRQKTSGAEHSSTLAAMAKLVQSYRSAGRLEEAIRLEEEYVKHQKSLLPREHPFLTKAISNLAEDYAAAGRTDEAQILRSELAAKGTTPVGEK